MRTGLPELLARRPSRTERDQYELACAAFATLILDAKRRLGLSPTLLGWCYYLETNVRLIDKDEFAAAEGVINLLRKSGMLSIDICEEDERRVARGVERLHGSIDEMIGDLVNALRRQHKDYTPISFWDDQDYYLGIAVKKVDLRNLFDPVARRYHIAIQNVGGCADLPGRLTMICRLYERWIEDRDCRLGYRGNHDPGGMVISDWSRSNLMDMARAAAQFLGVRLAYIRQMISELPIERFGLNKDFIDLHGLTWIDNLITTSGGNLASPRRRDHYRPYVQDYLRQFGPRKVEANALVARPDAGRQFV